MPPTLPPDFLPITEPISAQMIYTDALRLEVKNNTVRLHLLTAHRLTSGAQSWRRDATVVLTPGQFMDAIAAINLAAMKAGLTISGRAKVSEH